MSWRAESYETLHPAHVEGIRKVMERAPFFALLGLETEEIRRDYARMRLPYRPQLNQPQGVVHGGAIASLIDTVVVAPIASGLPRPPKRMLTVDMHVHYLGAIVESDAIAEGWVRKRGRSTVFLAAEVFDGNGALCAHGELCYRVVPSD